MDQEAWARTAVSAALLAPPRTVAQWCVGEDARGVASVEKVERAALGTFVEGESYVVLFTRSVAKKESTATMARTAQRCDDIFVWIGPLSAIGERKLAARCALALEARLMRSATTTTSYCRVAGGCESATFLRVWAVVQRAPFRIVSGGAEGAYDPQHPERFERKLLHVSRGGAKDSPTLVRAVAPHAASMNCADSFIMNDGADVYCWFGPGASGFERAEAAKRAREIAQRQCNAKLTLVESRLGATPPPGPGRAASATSLLVEEATFFALIEGSAADVVSLADAEAAEAAAAARRAALRGAGSVYTMLHLSDANAAVRGGVTATLLQEGVPRLDIALLDPTDAFVFLLSQSNELIVWWGADATEAERVGAMEWVEDYLAKSVRLRAPPHHCYVEVRTVLYLDFSNRALPSVSSAQDGNGVGGAAASALDRVYRATATVRRVVDGEKMKRSVRRAFGIRSGADEFGRLLSVHRAASVVQARCRAFRQRRRSAAPAAAAASGQGGGGAATPGDLTVAAQHRAILLRTRRQLDERRDKAGVLLQARRVLDVQRRDADASAPRPRSTAFVRALEAPERWRRANEREVTDTLTSHANRGFCFGRPSSSAPRRPARAPAQLSAREARAAMQRTGNLDEMRSALGSQVARAPKLCAAGSLRARDAYLRLTASGAGRGM
jgi:hypothetical protein